MRASDIVFALAATLPLSAIGLVVGVALEWAGVSAKVRERVSGLAFWVGPAASALALIDHALPRRTNLQIEVVLRSTPLAALSQATHALAQTPRWHLPEAFEIVLGVMALGAVFRLTHLARAWLALRALRRDAMAAPAETVRAVRAAGLKPSIPVRLSAEASTPVALGLFKPEVLLPERFATSEAAPLAGLVCRHEAQHIVRRDNARLLLEQLIGALLWFDPLRGALHRRLLAAREERCDAAALADRTPAERTLYAKALLEALTQPALPALAVGLIGAGRSHAMTRISAIIDPQPARNRPALTVGLCGLLASTGGGAALAASQADPPALMRTASAIVATLPPAVQTQIRFAEAATNPEDAPRAAQTVMKPPQPPADASGPVESWVIQRIVIEGSDKIPASLTLSSLKEFRGIAPGRTVTAADLDLARTFLLNSDMFSDVLVWIANEDPSQPGAGDLRVKVTEKPGLPGDMPSLPRIAQNGGPISVTADRLEKDDDARMVRYAGNVQIAAADLRAALGSARLFVDGQAAPADVDLSGAGFAAVELRFAPGPGGFGKLESLNYLTHP